MSRQSPDRRLACGRTNNDTIKFFGGCSQPNTKTANGPEVYVNVSKAKGLGDGTNPTEPQLPYVRPNYPVLCGDYMEPPAYPFGDYLNGYPPVNLPTPEEINVSPQGIQIPLGIYSNSFTASNQTMSYAQCQKIKGYKQVVGTKSWQGRPSFHHPLFSGGTEAIEGEYLNCLKVRAYEPEPEAQKYLTLDFNCKVQITLVGDLRDGNPPVDLLSSYEYASHEDVGRYTGVRTGYTSSAEVTEMYINVNIGSASVYAGRLFGYSSPSPDLAVTHFVTSASLYVGVPEATIVRGETPSVVYYQEFDDGMGGTYHITQQISASLADGSFRSYYHNSLYQEDRIEEWHCSETDFAYYREINVDHYGDASLITTIKWWANTNLSNPYKYSECLEDLYALLATWDLGDDDRLPWRTDFEVTMAPLVTYAELGTAWPGLHEYIDYELGDPYYYQRYDGRIKGKPTSVVVDKFWNPEHPNWQTCGTPCTVKQVVNYGAYSTECYTNCATQWIDKWERSRLPQGAYLLANVLPGRNLSACTADAGIQYDDRILACKYAEIIVDKPSFNFFRPAGKDRLQISASKIDCIKSASFYDKVMFLQDTGTGIEPTTLQTGDICYVHGHSFDTASFNGVWTVTRDGDYQITLNQQLASGSWWTEFPFYSTTVTPWIGKLAYAGYPGILGRVDITDISKTNPATCSLLESCYLFPGDLVIVSGSRNTGTPTSFDTYWKVHTVLDSQHVVLCDAGPSASLMNGVSASYVASSGQMYSAFAPHWKWDDTGTKNEFAGIQWHHNYRDVYEYNRLKTASSSLDPSCTEAIQTVPAEPRPYQINCGMPQEVERIENPQTCLPYNACKPSVAYFSPNEEPLLTAKYNSVNLGFGTNRQVLDQYGGQWNALVRQYDTDYLFLPAICPCTFVPDNIEDPEGTGKYKCNCTMTEDNGHCDVDIDGDAELGIDCIKYYPGRPYVEYRSTLPEGAPAYLRNKVGCLSIEQMNASLTCPDGVVCYPPRNGAFALWTGMWWDISLLPYHYIYERRRECICNGGRFSAEYQKGRISC